jgi:hypothetical protein
VLLNNGDEFPGIPVSLDDKTLVLDTWYAGKLNIPRSMIRSITRRNGDGNPIYQGPASLQEWTPDENAERDDYGRVLKNWTYKDGVLTAVGYGGIRRDMKLPASADIGFDLTLPASEPDLDLQIYGENTQEVRNCYMFQFGLGGVDFKRVANGRAQEMGGPANLENGVFRREKVRVEIRVNKETKTIWLLVNGKQAGQWTDPAGFAGTGTNLRFTSQLDQGAIKISNITVSAWDGGVGGAQTPTDNPPKEDVLLMNNKDRAAM